MRFYRVRAGTGGESRAGIGLGEAHVSCALNGKKAGWKVALPHAWAGANERGRFHQPVRDFHEQQRQCADGMDRIPPHELLRAHRTSREIDRTEKIPGSESAV